jgi:hypothetical protein
MRHVQDHRLLSRKQPYNSQSHLFARRSWGGGTQVQGLRQDQTYDVYYFETHYFLFRKQQFWWWLFVIVLIRWKLGWWKLRWWRSEQFLVTRQSSDIRD